MGVDPLEAYWGFSIRPYERELGRWRAEIKKLYGSQLVVPLAGGRAHHSTTTSADASTRETAIEMAKQVIDAGLVR